MPSESESADRAERALSEGAYGEAAEHLREFLKFARDRADRLPPDTLRAADQLGRQAALMRDLCAESLSDMLRAARGLSDRAWREQFRSRYQGRALVFDSIVRPDGSGDYLLDWEFAPGDGDVRLSLRGLRLLNRVVAGEGRRLIFGFRIAEARRDPRGGWVVTADPESGVLLTHPRILTGTSLATDAELAEVFNRQAE